MPPKKIAAAQAQTGKAQAADPFRKEVHYGPNIAYSTSQLVRVKDIASLSFGSCCGILRLSSWKGVLFFLATNVLVSLCYYVFIAGGRTNAKNYYVSPFNEIFVSNVARFLASYVMMWCLLYAFVNT